MTTMDSINKKVYAVFSTDGIATMDRVSNWMGSFSEAHAICRRRRSDAYAHGMSIVKARKRFVVRSDDGRE